MTRKSIIILIIITALFAATAYTLLQKNPEIEKIIFSENNLLTEKEIEVYNENNPEFDSEKQIYAILLVKNLLKGSVIEVQWKINEIDAEELVQENSITVKDEGSGKIVVSLVQKNRSNRSGEYNVYVTMGEQKLKSSFNIR